MKICTQVHGTVALGMILSTWQMHSSSLHSRELGLHYHWGPISNVSRRRRWRAAHNRNDCIHLHLAYRQKWTWICFHQLCRRVAKMIMEQRQALYDSRTNTNNLWDQQPGINYWVGGGGLESTAVSKAYDCIDTHTEPIKNAWWLSLQFPKLGTLEKWV